MLYSVYILKCSDGTYYTGLAKDLDARLYEQQAGANPEAYTFSRRAVVLVWTETVYTYREAFQFEHQIKGWSKAKKEALIRGDISGIHEIVKAERKTRDKKKASKRAK